MSCHHLSGVRKSHCNILLYLPQIWSNFESIWWRTANNVTVKSSQDFHMLDDEARKLNLHVHTVYCTPKLRYMIFLLFNEFSCVTVTSCTAGQQLTAFHFYSICNCPLIPMHYNKAFLYTSSAISCPRTGRSIPFEFSTICPLLSQKCTSTCTINPYYMPQSVHTHDSLEVHTMPVTLLYVFYALPSCSQWVSVTTLPLA